MNEAMPGAVVESCRTPVAAKLLWRSLGRTEHCITMNIDGIYEIRRLEMLI